MFITIDGDDVGQKITSAYLKNDKEDLIRINDLVNTKTNNIARMLKYFGFEIIFCAADGVAGFSEKEIDKEVIFNKINDIANGEMSFSAGVGDSLRESYIALTFSKSDGKCCIHHYKDFV